VEVIKRITETRYGAGVAQYTDQAPGWTVGVLEFNSRRGLGIFLFTTASETALGPTQPSIQGVSGGKAARA
jgi:hypothetical protein